MILNICNKYAFLFYQQITFFILSTNSLLIDLNICCEYNFNARWYTVYRRMGMLRLQYNKTGLTYLIKRIAAFSVLSILTFLLTACSNYSLKTLPVVSDFMPDPIVEIEHLRVGVVSGPYQDMFNDAVLPSLVAMGYTAEFTYFSNYSSPNFALAQNEVDLNIFQHYVYLNTFKFENDLALTAIMEIPTVSMQVFSSRFDDINDITTNISVSIPGDASNLARALRVLETAGIITLDPAIDKLRATIDDIVDNPFLIRFSPIPAHELVNSLETYDLAVINGNYVISGGLNLSDSLFQETLVENYMNVIAVRTDDLNKQFVRDIIDIIYSDSFQEIIADPDGSYAGFQWPRWFHDAVQVRAET